MDVMAIALVRRPIFGLLALIAAPLVFAQEPNTPQVSPPPSAVTPAPTPGSGGNVSQTASNTDAGQAETPSLAGMSQPAVLVPATSDEATVSIVLRDLKPPKTATDLVAYLAADLAAGPLVSSLQPNLQTRPSVKLLKVSSVQDTGGYLAELRIKGLFAFGESSAPLLYQGRQVETLRFSKPGLVVKPSSDSGYVAREGSDLLFPLILENPSGFEYKTVRARLRFADKDLCSFGVESFAPASASEADRKSDSKSSDSSGGKDDPCRSYLAWTSFEMRQYAPVTLRAEPPAEWFLDPSGRYARSDKKKGLLTLRYGGEAGGPIHEQNLPVEVQFEPSPSSLVRSLAWVAMWLVVGAFISLLLRVSVPNIKRKRALKDQLNEHAKLTASVSTEVDSTLRVLLRVERLALDEIRKAVFPIGPNYADVAQRVEKSLPTLKRRIDAVRRLDATLTRHRLMLGQNPAPTRMEQIESHLAAASETLKQDNLSEEDWVFVTQRLEAAQKILREPTQTEKEAFDALLSGRWKAIREHFLQDKDGGLIVPPLLKDMSDCFPHHSLLPKLVDDLDGTKWIQSVGPTRADLQLYALALIREFQFLLPSSSPGEPWLGAMKALNGLLATPVVTNLREAKSLLRQLAEDISEKDIVEALQEGLATIVMDPPEARPNQRIHFTVRFRDARLNLSAARELVSCRWAFDDEPRQFSLGGARRSLSVFWARVRGLPPAKGNDDRPLKTLCEDGWSIHHFFEKNVEQSTISVDFYDSRGLPIKLQPESSEAKGDVRSRQIVAVEASSRSREHWARVWLEMFQLIAALLVPLAALASQTVNGASVGNWWEIVAIGFASDTIKSILVGRPESTTTS